MRSFNCRSLALLGMTTIAMLLMTATESLAQRDFRGSRRSFSGDPNEFYVPPDWGGNVPYDGRVTFARIKYRGYGRFQGREGPGWSHDYPRAEEHFMRIIREITSMRPFVENAKTIGSNLFALDDPELMKYPVAYLSEPAGWFPNEKEVMGLRNYLLKGGFVIVDDFDAEEYEHFVAVMQQVLPNGRPVELPLTHPIFDAFFKVDLSLIGRGGGGANYGPPRYLAYYQNNDPKKRIIMVVNLNGDIGEYWQWSDQGFSPVPSNEAYKLGVNYLIYALTH